MFAIDVAKYIVKTCIEKGYKVTNLQLQKMLYYIQVECFKKLGKECFCDDIEAWKFGPVVREVYYEFYIFGGFPIFGDYCGEIEDEKIKEITNQVIEDKKNLPPWALVNDTHAPGKAWARTYERFGTKSVIQKEDIRRHG